jgi:hypothetical protein
MFYAVDQLPATGRGIWLNWPGVERWKNQLKNNVLVTPNLPLPTDYSFTYWLVIWSLDLVFYALPPSTVYHLPAMTMATEAAVWVFLFPANVGVLECPRPTALIPWSDAGPTGHLVRQNTTSWTALTGVANLDAAQEVRKMNLLNY